MNYVYVLHSRQDGNLYLGCTKDLQKRIREHNTGKVYSTKGRIPMDLIYYETFINKTDAFAREQWLKTGWGRKHMQKMLSNTLKSLGGQE
jgi:putative endonuclease